MDMTFRSVAEAILVLILLGSREKKEVLVIDGFKYFYFYRPANQKPSCQNKPSIV